MKQTIPYILYARKSSEGDDRQVQSIDAQLTELQKIANRDGLSIVKIFQEAKSAKKPLNRPQFDEMIRMIEDGKAQGILTWALNRLSRNPAENGLLQQLLQDGKIRKIQTFDRAYEPEDNALLFSVEASMSNQFIIDLRKNVKRGIREKARNGGISGLAPEGYVNNRLNKTVEIDPIRFPLIKKAFESYLTGNFTVGEIKKMLDDWGYITIKRNKNGGKPISRTALYGMFANVRYVGLVPNPDCPDDINSAIKGQFSPMITLYEYERIQGLLGRRGRTRYVTKKHFELKGLLKCGECGCSITAERKTKLLKNGSANFHTYYHCTKKRSCKQRGIREDELFAQLEKFLKEYEITDELYDWGLKAINDIANDEIKQRDDVQQMQFKSIKEIQDKLNRLLDLVTDGIITADDYKQKTAALKTELTRRQDQQADAVQRAKN